MYIYSQRTFFKLIGWKSCVACWFALFSYLIYINIKSISVYRGAAVGGEEPEN